jgi:hypothetical protein
MTSTTPKVTIGLMVYNGENYLAEAIESILAQSYSDFEVVISDNGSTDRTADICRHYARLDRRIRFYRHEQNRGAAWNCNRVFELARGEYFKWMAHDDRIEPEYLARCVALLDTQPEVAWCQTRVLLIDGEGQRLSGNINAWNDPTAAATAVHSVLAFDPGGKRGDRTSPRPSERFAAVLLGVAWCLDCFGLIRSDALRQTRGCLATYGAEKTLVGELSLVGRYAEIAEPLQHIRIHTSGSGQHTTVAEQQAFMGRRRTSGWLNPRLQLLIDQFTTALRMPLSPAERLRCLWAVTRYLFQLHKWRSVLSSMLQRKGTGGGNGLFLSDDDDDQRGGERVLTARERSSTTVAERVASGGASLVMLASETLPLL